MSATKLPPVRQASSSFSNHSEASRAQYVEEAQGGYEACAPAPIPSIHPPSIRCWGFFLHKSEV